MCAFYKCPYLLTYLLWPFILSANSHKGAENCSLYFLTSGHSDAQGWASECPDVKNYKWRLNPSCTGCFCVPTW